MHHISDVDTWGKPDRNYYIFVACSILFGFIGFDHFYLRSFGTGTQKLVVNFLTLGFWYWWDIIQVFTDGKKIREEGLNSPLDWIQGIGRGVFAPMPGSKQAGGGEKCSDSRDSRDSRDSHNEESNQPTFEAKKSYLLYTFLAICFGWLGADKFYLGEGWQGLAKILSCFNIFLFLFGWMWVIWDAFHAFFRTDDVVKHGISAPMPYSFLFNEPIDPDVFVVKEVSPEERKREKSVGLLDWIAKTFGFPDVPQGVSMRNIYRELLAPLMIPPVVKGIQEITHPTFTVPTLPSMPSLSSMSSLPPLSSIPSLSDVVNSATQGATNAIEEQIKPIKSMVPMSHTTSTRSEVASAAEAKARPMSGGGYPMDIGSGPGPVIAGALTAVVLAGGLKGFYDMISKQYG